VSGGGGKKCTEEVIEVNPAPVGVRVSGREVVKVTPGSQAEEHGVQVGWQLVSVGGKEMPPSGQVAADAITRALAAGKLGGAKYQIRFVAPKTPTTTSLNASKPVASKAVGASKQSGGGVASVSTAFGQFSSGLGGCGGAASSFSLGVPAGVMEAAHQSLNVMAEGMAELETA